ncbi:TPA: conjugal transfer protein TraD [Burkholderia vietnamiensis]|nr:conjugal transfer protein TraD [Burkholderia vietnamiensis]HDR9102376.1 conjugal transfer protein TraD [Burkholderia vietnamiensis]HDR9121972.1 conjugal transfer protein TraD [Burkholderia vietnamiensis]HDR9170121.1 conjugal transfer protein TraD [Burkholderia vietnamiensis]HDR9284132.1 conjugal transfer protein TraD [Burkholderia vietnamiensis]
MLAGLLDGRTGLPVWEQAELLGAMLQLVATPSGSEASVTWKRIGGALRNTTGRRWRLTRESLHAPPCDGHGPAVADTPTGAAS